MHVTLRPVLAATLLVLVTAAPAPAAAPGGDEDPLCPVLSLLMESAAHGFVPLRGPAKQDASSTWVARTAVPGATGCLIEGGPPPAYSCTLYTGRSPAEADTSYRDAAARAAKCLGAEWTTSEQVDGAHERTSISRGPGAAVVRVRSRRGADDTHVVELWLDARQP